MPRVSPPIPPLSASLCPQQVAHPHLCPADTVLKGLAFGATEAEAGRGSPTVRSLAGPSPTWSSRREERTIHKWSELLATLFLLFFFQIWCL